MGGWSDDVVGGGGEELMGVEVVAVVGGEDRPGKRRSRRGDEVGVGFEGEGVNEDG